MTAICIFGMVKQFTLQKEQITFLCSLSEGGVYLVSQDCGKLRKRLFQWTEHFI